jgi:hypothetical protein
VIIALDPGAIDAKDMVRVFPLPPQTPPPVELHELNERLAESTSVTVMEVAVAGPRLVTTIVLVTSVPVSTGLGARLVRIERSAGEPPDNPPT